MSQFRSTTIALEYPAALHKLAEFKNPSALRTKLLSTAYPLKAATGPWRMQIATYIQKNYAVVVSVRKTLCAALASDRRVRSEFYSLPSGNKD